MNEMKLFEVATRKKYRFPYKGSVSVEDLWDLGVDALDSIFKVLNRQAKTAQEESLLSVRNAEDEELDNKISIVKYIVSVKQREAADRVLDKERKEKKQKIMDLIDKKRNEAMENMSEEDLVKMLSEIG